MNNENLDMMLSEAQDGQNPQDVSNKFLTFFIENKLYGLAITNVNGITQIQEITPMPELPYYVKGIINMRGTVIPLIDVNLRFGNMEQPYTDRTCIITLEISGNQVGFIVDAVEAVLDIPDESISPPPPITGSTSGYITGIGKCGDNGTKIVLLLDSYALVGEAAFDMSAFGDMTV
ncbi:MAG: chemotaxis protein CheW [Oscillospiraceae bacterium]|nr:chemotaxis protein CheW [Oscillospiraceae bacterium]